MKATEAKLIEFLKKSPQFVIPIYQRTYSWTEKECRQLRDDIVRTGRDGKLVAHFVGSIVYVEKGLSNLTTQEPLLVIDGQQRLTTLTLLLAMSRSHCLQWMNYLMHSGSSGRRLKSRWATGPICEGHATSKWLKETTMTN